LAPKVLEESLGEDIVPTKKTENKYFSRGKSSKVAEAQTAKATDKALTRL